MESTIRNNPLTIIEFEFRSTMSFIYVYQNLLYFSFQMNTNSCQGK